MELKNSDKKKRKHQESIHHIGLTFSFKVEHFLLAIEKKAE